MKRKIFQNWYIFIGCILLCSLLLTACGTTVTWLDAEGALIETAKPEKDEALPERPLPPDDDDWHYTGWAEVVDGNKITYTAERVPMIKYTWKDADGTVLETVSVPPEEPAPIRGLPNDTDEWQYTKWNEEKGENTVTYTAERVAKIRVTWLDADGKQLHRESILPTAHIPDRPLPADSGYWIYTGWDQVTSGNTVTCTAKRVPAKTVIWRDGDGKELAKRIMPADEAIPDRPLPASDKWDYTKWVESVTGATNKTYTYTAKGEPKLSYFAANVFQLVGEDLMGNPIMVGSGFVLNSDGWFITNYHILENACAAHALFEIPDTKNGKSFTKLSILDISWYNADRDLLIGKIENYSSRLKTHYKSIPLQTKYSVGDTTYSVGYPGGAAKAELHEGKILSNLAGLADKLYSGVNYISSDSYIAPGSSGGVLLNSRLEVIGITSRVLNKDDQFVLGASIGVFNFQSAIGTAAKDSELKDIAEALHPGMGDFINFFRNEYWANTRIKVQYDEDGLPYLLDEWEQETTNCRIVSHLVIYPNGDIALTKEHYWTNGDEMVQLLGGTFEPDKGKQAIDQFSYIFGYQYADGQAYVVTCEDINYSTNVDLCLSHYEASASWGSVTAEDMKYTRERFANLYRELSDRIF